MKQLSVSFTLGKESRPNNVNVRHNNRDFSAHNVEFGRTINNIIYVSEAPEKSYDKLFSEALEEYNRNQRKSRRIDNYYKHILNSKREEAFYEAIVQFGDKDTAPCFSSTGEKASEMLSEFLEDFRKRNPNLYVFNAVQHLDEASPHLHIDFIPFYTKGRTNGLSKGVSLKAALIEEGFLPTNYKQNQVVAWEESERNAMEKILNRHGFERENKHAQYSHMTVEEYKMFNEDRTKLRENLLKVTSVTREEMEKENVIGLRSKVSVLEKENSVLKTKMKSEFVPCYYSSPEKLAFVLAALDNEKIPYHETETGFEVQQHHLDTIRKIEKSYRPLNTTYRAKLCTDIDKLLLSVGSLDELYLKLQELNYKVKRGKYVSVCPPESEKYIRIKSLGEFYSELALRNRIIMNKSAEKPFHDRLKQIAGNDSFERMTVQSICIYFANVKQGKIPMRKRNEIRPFTWKNDAELDRLTELNARINAGATLDSLKNEFSDAENSVNIINNQLSEQKELLDYYTNLKEKIEVVFSGKPAPESKIQEYKKELDSFTGFSITEKNYKGIYTLIENKKSSISELESELKEKNNQLKKAADYFEFAQKVAGGTYVQSLSINEHIRKNADFIPHGIVVR